MTQHENLKILAFVGMTGSGKTAAVQYFTEQGFPKVHFGNIAYDIMAERGIEKGEENEKKFRVAIREEFGPTVYAMRIIDQIHHLSDAGQHRIIADGLYTWDEYKAMKHEFPGELTVVAIVGDKHLRYRRLEQRVDDRPQTAEISRERDQNEIEGTSKGGPIAAADHFILNNGTIEELHEHLSKLAREIEFS